MKIDIMYDIDAVAKVDARDLGREVLVLSDRDERLSQPRGHDAVDHEEREEGEEDGDWIAYIDHAVIVAIEHGRNDERCDCIGSAHRGRFSRLARILYTVAVTVEKVEYAVSVGVEVDRPTGQLRRQ